MLQRDAIEEFHGDEGFAVLFADVVDGADVGMVEGGGSLGFPLEARQSLRITGDLFRKKFEGHEAMQADVFGLIDHTHPAAAQLLDDPVMRYGLTDHCLEKICGGSSRGDIIASQCIAMSQVATVEGL